MKVPRIAKIVLIFHAVIMLIAVTAAALWATQGNSGFFGIKPYSNGRLPANVRLRCWDQQSTEIVEADLDASTDSGRELAIYLSEATSSGGTASVGDHAPRVIIESDLVRVNILSNTVVISKRNRAAGSWSQWVRKKNADDEAIEQTAMAYLQSSP
ncbi:MAG: hypothetical protein KDA31_13760 [Phycisphaerales bacterium]|nr:hypothetical protein [Phycisphaerales bacterium]MCB9837654.1 hypothetical protein [Phycisphaera sp.]